MCFGSGYKDTHNTHHTTETKLELQTNHRQSFHKYEEGPNVAWTLIRVNSVIVKILSGVSLQLYDKTPLLSMATYPQRLLFQQSSFLLLLRLLLELIVAHGHDGEDEVDEVEAAEEDDEEEEDDVPRSRGPQHGLVKVFPVILDKVSGEIFLHSAPEQ